jgi:hypothetical protein
MWRWRKVRRPDIPQELHNRFEQLGEIVLAHAVATASRVTPPMAPELSSILENHRDDLLAWLKWKAARNAFWSRVIIGATVIGAIAAVLAAIFSYLALGK